MSCCSGPSHEEILAQRNAQQRSRAQYAGIPIVIWAKQYIVNTFTNSNAKNKPPKRTNTYQK